MSIPGKGPSSPPPVPSARIPSEVSPVTCHEARLRRNGTLGVRSIWSTSVCVHSDSTNHPA